MLDVGLANELKAAFRRGNWTNQEIKRLSEGDTLAQVRKVLLGHASITTFEHMVDLDADPFVPDGWSVEEHQKGGQFKWNPAAVKLYLSEPQKRGRTIEGNKLRSTFMGEPVLNANLLDYLLAKQHFIPEEWKSKYVFFWGTIYRGSGGSLYVRYLVWGDDGWRWDYDWLHGDFDGDSPAALRTS